MKKIVTIIDYGIGNICSVTRALEYWGAEVIITDKPQDILKASKLILPGVGAFSNGMQGLKERNLIPALKEYAANNKPLLGICLGMQLLFTESTEFGQHSGLDIIRGKIIPIEPKDDKNKKLKVPHIGWNKLEQAKNDIAWEKTIFKYISNHANCYFVHSFTAVPTDNINRLADTYYGTSLISAAVVKGNIYGCQFHPEKSGIIGLKVIKGFLEI